MTQQIINIGTAPNDGTGDPARNAFDKCNLNFTELYQVSRPTGNAIEYQFNNTTTEPPSVGQIRFNQATQASTTKLWASHTTSSGVNIKQFLAAATTGAKLVLQDKNDNTNYIKFDVTGAPVDKTTYWEFAVAVTASGGNLPNAPILAAVTAGVTAGGGGGGAFVKHVYAESTSILSFTTAMAGGVDTIPQQTDGTQVLTATITPASSSNKLWFVIVIPYSAGPSMGVWTAVFQDTTAAALTTVWKTHLADAMGITTLAFEMTAGTTAATTFKVRMGQSTGGSNIIRVLSDSGGRRGGGSMRMTMRISELSA